MTRKPTLDILGDPTVTLANPAAGAIATATELPIAQVRRDGGTQPRAAIDPGAVAAYADDMREGRWHWDRDLPVVFYDGSTYWLADGFHRFASAEQAELTAVPCDVRQGDRRAAILHSVGANANHGLRRTNEDKRRAVATLLSDAEWSQWSDREIARRCQVSHELVNGMRPSLSDSDSENRIYTTKHGTPATMNTAPIAARSLNGPTPQALTAVRTWITKHVSTGQRTYALRNYRTPPFSNTLKQYTAGIAPEQIKSVVNWLIANPNAIDQSDQPDQAEPEAPRPAPPITAPSPSRNGHATPARDKPLQDAYNRFSDNTPRPAVARFAVLDETEADSLANVVEGQCVDAVSVDETGRLLLGLRNGFAIHIAAVTEAGRPALAWRIVS